MSHCVAMAEKWELIVAAAQRIAVDGGGRGALADVLRDLDAYDRRSVRAALMHAMTSPIERREEVERLIAAVFGALVGEEAD